MKEKKYFEWIDTLKGIGIFYVTFAHLAPWYPLEKHIYSFHMFLFFFISGYLFRVSDNYKRYVKKRANVLLLPFVFWNVLATLCAIVIDGENINEALKKMFILEGKMCWNAPIWFLLILFLVEVIYMLIARSKYRYYEIIVLFAALVLARGGEGHNVILKFGIVPMGIVYFCIGNMCKKYYFFEKIYNIRKWIFLVSIIINGIFGVLLNSRISVINCYYDNYIYSILAGISGIMIYYMISNYINDVWALRYKIFNYINVWLKRIGKDSMIIMCSQYFFFRLYNLISQTDIWHMRNTVKAFVVAICTIIFVEVISYFFKKWNLIKLGKLIGIR